MEQINNTVVTPGADRTNKMSQTEVLSPLAISAHGPQDARAMLIVDGATDRDITKGLAITDDQEREIRSLLKNQPIHFEEFWKTALIKERIDLRHPEENRKLLSDRYKQILINEINTIRPNVLVPLSELSFNFLTGLTGIRKFRGSLLPTSNGLPLCYSPIVIPTLGPHPYLNEDRKMAFIARLDFEKIAKNQYAISIPVVDGHTWICESATSFRDFVNRHYEKADFLVFDIETFVNLPTCISFSFDGNEACCVPLIDFKVPLDQRVLLLNLILTLLKSPIPKVNQNIKFDYRKLRRIGWTINGIIGDTMLAQHLLYCEYPKNLGFLTSIYTEMPYFKDEGKEFDPSKFDRKKLYTYCAKDSLATHQCFAQQRKELVELGVDHVNKLLIDILPTYCRMEENGLLVDDLQRRKLLSRYWTIFNIQAAKLNKLVGREINPLSSVAIGRLVYEELKWRVVRGVKHKKDGGPSADEESLEILMWKSECNSSVGKFILQTIINCRKLHKVIEFLELPTYTDGRHRCEFNLAGAETGRTTASETTDYKLYFDGKKIKLQNLGHSFQTIGKHGFSVDGVDYGKELRSIFVPSPGHSFVECDLSQAEARVDAILARDYDILAIFDTPVGIHRLTGSWVYNCSPEEIKKNVLVDGEDRYHTAKTVRHAGERNLKEDRLMMMIHQPIPYCQKILKTFHDRQPNIRGVFHKEIREAVQARTLIAPNGRRRDFYGRIDEHTINEGISQLPQAIVTDYNKEAIRRAIPGTEDWVRPLSESHDSFLVETLHGRETEWASKFKLAAEQPIDFKSCTLSRDFQLIIPADAEMSTTNLSEMETLR